MILLKIQWAGVKRESPRISSAWREPTPDVTSRNRTISISMSFSPMQRRRCHQKLFVGSPALDELTYYGDEDLLRKMMSNLLDNAVKCTPPGGRIRLGLEVGREVRDLVTNSGPVFRPMNNPKVCGFPLLTASRLVSVIGRKVEV
jgi:hypothetical protein